MTDPPTDNWADWWTNVAAYSKQLRKSKAVNVNTEALREGAKRLVQDYFRNVRPSLDELAIPDDSLDTLDSLSQRLLNLANGRNSKAAYQSVIRDLRKVRPKVEFERELLIGKQGSMPRAGQHGGSDLENAILKTLRQMIPSAALSYEQAARDLHDEQRISSRGTAAELRETLREVLDHLAPDADVLKSNGFKLEKDRKRPTMKQKVKFILRSRGLGSTAVASPSAAVERVVAGTENLTRSVYDRGSVATHVSTSRREVRQIKLYVDGILAELLEI